MKIASIFPGCVFADRCAWTWLPSPASKSHVEPSYRSAAHDTPRVVDGTQLAVPKNVTAMSDVPSDSIRSARFALPAATLAAYPRPSSFASSSCGSRVAVARQTVCACGARPLRGVAGSRSAAAHAASANNWRAIARRKVRPSIFLRPVEVH